MLSYCSASASRQLKPYYCTSDFIWCAAQGSTLRKDHQQINLQTL